MTDVADPADRLARVGRALYGEHWRLPLARALRVNERLMRRWMSGRTPLAADDPVLAAGEALVAEIEKARAGKATAA